ncbi:hypothetical protein [Actinomadura keratinilytica]|uniref:hypothetical protein n=1 Tax=Actinomadura keratinilytica TaxID=547461 RepID=UPI003616EE55
MAVILTIVFVVAFVALLTAGSAVKVVQQYEHGIVFRFGQVRRGDRLRPGAVRPPASP